MSTRLIGFGMVRAIKRMTTSVMVMFCKSNKENETRYVPRHPITLNHSQLLQHYQMLGIEIETEAES